MQLTVLGSSGTYPGGPGRACSGFLVTQGDVRLLLDCGTGVLANLQAHVPIDALDAIIISHMHADHFIDLLPVRYAFQFGNHPRETPLTVYLPPGGEAMWEYMVKPLAEPGTPFSKPFKIAEYQERTSHQIGELNVRFVGLHHYIPSYGMEVSGNDSLVYSADTAPCEELVSLAQGADLFLCEATWLPDSAPLPQRGHLTAKEAGEAAREAGAGRLLLTHISPAVDASESLKAAKDSCGGEVLLAQEGQT